MVIFYMCLDSFTAKPSEAYPSRLDYSIDYLNIDSASRFMQECKSELIISKLNPLLVPRTWLTGLMF